MFLSATIKTHPQFIRMRFLLVTWSQIRNSGLISWGLKFYPGVISEESSVCIYSYCLFGIRGSPLGFFAASSLCLSLICWFPHRIALGDFWLAYRFYAYDVSVFEPRTHSLFHQEMLYRVSLMGNPWNDPLLLNICFIASLCFTWSMFPWRPLIIFCISFVGIPLSYSIRRNIFLLILPKSFGNSKGVCRLCFYLGVFNVENCIRSWSACFICTSVIICD